MSAEFAFVPAGTVACPKLGEVYVDVGNDLCPGVIDHHHPNAPDDCTAMLALRHPQYVVSQIVHGRLTIVLHEYPDLDAISGAWFARMHACGERPEKMHRAWAEYVCRIDQGHTTLDVRQPVTPYSLFMMHMHLLRERGLEESTASKAMLMAGFDFLEAIFAWMRAGGDLDYPLSLRSADTFSEEIAAIEEDRQRYERDRQRAQLTLYKLPRKDGKGMEEVSGLWVEMPESALFKSWARGDTESAGNDRGFVFLGVQVSEHRFILSVNPSSDVYLKGLGDALEEAETSKRKALGLERHGENRPGYHSPDPWYDGRSIFHNYTIVDSPRGGTVLNAREVARVLIDRYGGM